MAHFHIALHPSHSICFGCVSVCVCVCTVHVHSGLLVPMKCFQFTEFPFTIKSNAIKCNLRILSTTTKQLWLIFSWHFLAFLSLCLYPFASFFCSVRALLMSESFCQIFIVSIRAAYKISSLNILHLTNSEI